MTPIRGYPQLAGILAQELAAMPTRLARALEVLADARSPLKANSYEATISGGTGPDPGQTAIAAKAAHDRHQLIQAIKAIDVATRGLTRICNEWAPQPIKGTSNVWCDNHARYGQHEPQATDGSTNCRWCSDVKRNYGVLPTRALIELHDRGRRISEGEYRRLLGKGRWRE